MLTKVKIKNNNKKLDNNFLRNKFFKFYIKKRAYYTIMQQQNPYIVYKRKKTKFIFN